jgi:Na+-translocating ferredoxin:NAD+ oxidoreductase subunit B
MILVKDIDAVLPQTQCGECGYSGCLPYAEALAADNADLNLCPPGGLKVVSLLGDLLQKDVSKYIDATKQNLKKPSLAIIREDDCIGCTKCITACPVDAIIGTGKHMHTILDLECTGCGLCVEPCPVDCIDMVELESQADGEYTYNPEIARERFEAKKIRELQEKQFQSMRYLEKRKLSENTVDKQEDAKAKQAYILQALTRSKKNKPPKS